MQPEAFFNDIANGNFTGANTFMSGIIGGNTATDP
jgi:hypothetical protein